MDVVSIEWGLVHEFLYQAQNLSEIDFSACLGSVTQALLITYQPDTNRINLTFKVDTPPLELGMA